MKLENFKSDQEREVAVCIAVQKIGIADLDEIKNKIESWQAKITKTQIEKAAKNLQVRGIFSVNYRNNVLCYNMKRILYSVPEVANIHDIVDNEELKPLIEELDKSKKLKKGISAENFYKVNVIFEVADKVLGFIPNGSETKMQHYRDVQNNIIFFHRHWKRWMSSGLPLINRTPNAADDITYDYGICKAPKTGEDRFWITNVSGYTKGAGRGHKDYETLIAGNLIETNFIIPERLIKSERAKDAFEILCKKSFGAYAKAGHGILKVKEFNNNGLIWQD